MLYNPNLSSMLLGCLLSRTELLFSPKYPLSKGDFAPNKFHEIIFVCTTKLAQNGCQEIDPIEVESFLKAYPIQLEVYVDNNGGEFIETVKELANLDNYDMYYDTIRKLSLLRDLQDSGVDITEWYDEADEVKAEAELNKHTIQSILNELEYSQLKLRAKYDVNFTRDEMTAGEDTEDLLASFEESPAFGALLQSPYLSTLYQGWCKNHLLLRSAPSGVGKSRFAVGDLCNVAVGELWSEEYNDFIPNNNFQGRGFFIHTEMITRTEINPMFLACISGVEYRKITNGLLEPDEKKRVLKASEILLQNPLHIIDMPDFTSASIERIIKRETESEGCSYGVFDYVQLQPALSAEFKAIMNAPPREDLILKNLVTDLKMYAEKYNVGLMSMTQLNGNEKTMDFPDESCLSGSKAMKTKIDAGSIILNAKEKPKSLKRVEPFVHKRGFKDNVQPNIVEYMYKGRYSMYASEKVKVWSYFDRGTLRRHDFFVTNANDEIMNVPKSVVEDF